MDKVHETGGTPIYDLQDFKDRMILGLKAQWSEAELHIMASRLQGAKRAAAQRGELRLPLPPGYLYDDQGDWIIDPDEEVQAAVSDPNTSLTELRSGNPSHVLTDLGVGTEQVGSLVEAGDRGLVAEG